MAETITLFEHETYKYADAVALTMPLERLKNALGFHIVRVAAEGSQPALHASQYVGIVRVGGTTIQVLPKIYRTKGEGGKELTREEQAKEATHNLLYLLNYAGYLSITQHDLANLRGYDADWFEVLTYLFATHLLEEWQRGAYRTYQAVEDELPVLRGKLRVAEQLRHPARLQIFSVVYDEFTTDNRLNQVFRLVVERLWHMTRDAHNRRLLGDLQMMMDEVTLCPSITAAEAKPERLITRLNQRFAPLLTLARLFLDDSTLQLTSGDLSTYAFVFDMNRVFEGFVVNFIIRHRDKIIPHMQDYDLLPQTRQAGRALAKNEQNNHVFHLRPDLAVRDKTGKFPLLLDAKYKTLDPDKEDYDVSREDFYQMYAYARRYDCPRVLMIYPQTVGMNEGLCRRFTLEEFMVKNDKEEKHQGSITVATIDLRKELAYNNEQELICRFKELMIGEVK